MGRGDEGPSRRRWWVCLLVSWGILLVLSHLWWAFRTSPTQLGPEDRVAAVREVEGARLREREVRFVYRSYGTNDPSAPVLVLLHGSRGSFQDFDKLAARLPESFRILVPDLPGFGRSERELPDYSALAHAVYLEQLLDELEVERAHLVAFSMGGAVALELADRVPERVASIALVSALGVVELELFGDQRLNHGVHGAQLAGIQALRYGFPHFGGADRWMLGIGYARNFYDTDQSRLRGCLERFSGPLLVVHGEQDFLVPVEAAREHHRIVPQSELSILDASHFVLRTRPEEVAERVGDFAQRVEQDRAKRRNQANPERVAAAARPFDRSSIPPLSGPGLLVLMLVIVLATFISEDLTCIAAGLMVADGRIELLPAAFASGLGIFIGDVGLFLAGRWLGRPAVRRAPLRWFISPAALDRASDWFRKKGAKAVFLSRFMPGIRLPTYFAAGVMRTSLLSFALYFLIAMLVWTPLLVGFAAWVGSEALVLFERWGALALIGILLTLLIFERIVLRLFTWRGRRSLVGGWRRWTRWEFWPPWLFYPPVALYIAWLAVKHKSLAVATAANPAIPTGGFVGESKARILESLGSAGERVARHRLLQAAESVEERLASARELGDQYPIVLKPDVGQRGSGVRLVKNAGELEQALRELEVDHVLQEYVPGLEFGVFYAREPGRAQGRIFSITEKRLPTLVGDGKHTLEELILADERAVIIAPVYLRRHADHLQTVPAAGEQVRLVDVGTHCLGAVFLDAGHLATPELDAAIDELSGNFEGFHFGRYDLRVPSEEALRGGRDFRVLELNGLTSEATHIYDPKTPLREAYRVLFEQWRLAFAIGAANRAAGARPARLREVVRETVRYAELRRSHIR